MDKEQIKWRSVDGELYSTTREKSPVSGQHYGLITKECIIKAKPNDTAADQAFHIYRITKPLNGIVTTYGQHSSYDRANTARTSSLWSRTRTAAVYIRQCGFVRSHIMPNFFTDNYDHPIYEDGVQLVDMVYLQRPL